MKGLLRVFPGQVRPGWLVRGSDQSASDWPACCRRPDSLARKCLCRAVCLRAFGDAAWLPDALSVKGSAASGTGFLHCHCFY